MNSSLICSSVGIAFVLAGIFISSPTVITSLRTVPPDLTEQLLAGALLFRMGVVILGILIVVLGRVITGMVEIKWGEPCFESKNKDSISFVLVFFAALALRLYGLNAGLWHDEILTYVKYVRLPFGEIISTYEDQNQHFLYTLLAHASLSIFGDSAWSIRLPAALFGIASIWALYLLGRQVATSREALLASALLAFSYHHIWFSQNARGYMGLLFWTIFASWLFLRGLHENRPGIWVFYAVAAAFGTYTNTAMLFVIVSHVFMYLFQLWVRRNEARPYRWVGFWLGFGMAGFLTLFLHALALPQMLHGLVGEESTVPAWKNPLWALLEFVNAVQVGFAGSLVALAALVVFGLGLWSFGRTRPAVVELLILPALFCAIVVVGMGHHLWPRLFFFSFGFAALVVIRGAMLLGEIAVRLLGRATIRASAAGTVLAAGLILVSGVGIPRAYAPKQDFLGALNFVESNKQPGDAVVTVGLATFTYKNLYRRDWKEVKSLEELAAVRAHAKQTWLLYTFPTHVAAVHPDLTSTIQNDFDIVKKFPGTVGDGTVFVVRSNDRQS
jgi:hypothetical protein